MRLRIDWNFEYWCGFVWRITYYNYNFLGVQTVILSFSVLLWVNKLELLSIETWTRIESKSRRTFGDLPLNERFLCETIPW